MLLHFGLDDLSVTLLNALKVLLRLLKLRSAIEDKVLGRLYFVSNVVHDLRDHVQLARVKVPLVDALSAKKSVLVAQHLR